MWLVVKINYCIFENQNNQHYVSTDKYSWLYLNLPDEENKWGMSCFRGFTAPIGHQMISVEHWHSKNANTKWNSLFIFEALTKSQETKTTLRLQIEKSKMMIGDEDKWFITCWVEARRRQREQQRDQAFGLFGVERQAVAPRSSRIFCFGTLVCISFFYFLKFYFVCCCNTPPVVVLKSLYTSVIFPLLFSLFSFLFFTCCCCVAAPMWPVPHRWVEIRP